MKYINTSQIMNADGSVLGRDLYTAITAYFNDPEHQQEFEDWKKEQAKKERKQESYV